MGAASAEISGSSSSLQFQPAGGSSSSSSGRRSGGGGGGTVIDVPVSAIIRPLGKTRSDGEQKDDGRPPCPCPVLPAGQDSEQW